MDLNAEKYNFIQLFFEEKVNSTFNTAMRFMTVDNIVSNIKLIIVIQSRT